MDALVECGVFTQKNLELIVRVQNTRKNRGAGQHRYPSDKIVIFFFSFK